MRKMNLVDYDRLATEYAAHRQIHPGVLRALCGAASVEQSVLEVGCGTGNYITAVVAITGCHGWGIDPSAEMLASARCRCDRSPVPNVRLSLGRAESFGLQDGQFDLIFSVDVIHHVQDRAAYLREAYRALVPGGLVCTATDSQWIIRHREPLATYWPETIEIELKRYPRIHHLEALHQEAGFVALRRDQVEHCAPLTDASAYRAKAFSSLHLISQSAFLRGLARLEHDLSQGPVPWVSRYTLLWGAKP